MTIEQAVSAPARQQAAVARLGALALGSMDTFALAEEAAALVAKTLEIEVVHVLRTCPEGLRVQNALGCPRPCAGTLVSGPTMSDFALRNPGTVASGNLAEERRFAPAAHSNETGLRSGLAVAIGSVDRPAGALLAHARALRSYSEDECKFLEAVAHVIALALERKQIEEAHLGQSRVLQSVFDTLGAGVMVADRDGRIVLHNRAANALLGTALEGSKVAERYELFRADGVTRYGPGETPLNRALRGVSVDSELIFVRPEGLPGRWLTASARPLPGGDEGPGGATVVFTDVTAERAALRAVERGKADLRHLIDESPNGVLVLRGEEVVYANHTFLTALGHRDTSALVGRSLFALVSADEVAPLREFLDEVARGLYLAARETRFPRQDGQVARIELMPARLEEYEGGPATLFIVRDVTESRKLEQQLISAQKMELVGQLAGGIAHDFNNIIGALLVNVQLVLEQLGDKDPLRHEIEEMGKSGERAAALTHQLLAFSRQQVLQPRLLDLNGVVRDMDRLLGRVIGENIRLMTELAKPLGLVRADPGQLEQVILNVAINARDAMPSGGQLWLRTREVADPQLGPSVELAIEDTGTGMDEGTRERAFEPFFTTKEKGKGTGLGLSTVYGIVRQSGGRIEAFSERGRGTRIVVRLPIAQGASADAPLAKVPEPLPAQAHSGVILLVEDDDNVREAVRRVLLKRGFLVHEAADAEEAAGIAAGEPHFDLLLVDMVLPGATGTALAGRIKATHPGAQILYMSGYNDHALEQDGERTGSFFLQKPFTPELLLRKIRGILGTAL